MKNQLKKIKTQHDLAMLIQKQSASYVADSSYSALSVNEASKIAKTMVNAHKTNLKIPVYQLAIEAKESKRKMTEEILAQILKSYDNIFFPTAKRMMQRIANNAGKKA